MRAVEKSAEAVVARKVAKVTGAKGRRTNKTDEPTNLMKPTGSQTKPSGAATAAATGSDVAEKDRGPIHDPGVSGEMESSAKEGEAKVLNEENNKLMEKILTEDNLRAAFLAVKSNKGAAGIDGMGVNDLGDHLRKCWPGLKTKIKEGRYKPSPVRPVTIPKPGGGERQLGIPTVQDRFIQQAIHQQLDVVFDSTFSGHSYGFRKNRSAHDAVRAARAFVVEENRCWVIDIDIRAYFDRIDHDILMRLVAEKVEDKRVLKLIGKYLRSGVLRDGKVTRSAKGAPQGGPLSPLLGNIYLDALDKELESRGVAFCRYADDVTIYAKSERSAERTYESIVKWIEKHLKLEVNREKSGIRSPDTGIFLGFRIAEDGRIAMSKKSVAGFKDKVREHWDNRRHHSGPETIARWQRYIRGWIGYYRLSERTWDWENLESWIRQHIRKWFWQRWHNWKGRRNAFRKLGVRPCHLPLAHSGRGAWRMARILNMILGNQWLHDHGFWMPSDFVKGRVR